MGERVDNQDQHVVPAEPDTTSFTQDSHPAVTAGVPHIPTEHLEAVEFSNAIRLTGREWIGVGLFALLIFFFAPRLWKTVEPFPLEPDYRMPHDIANDYWLYERHATQSAEHYDAVLLGDSVVWGEYVKRDETLSHYLNEITGKQRYANLGLDGAMPLALEGLVAHYADNVRGKTVVLQCNPLWLSSPQVDLQDEKATNVISHPGLIPQFSPSIPAYIKEISPRLGVLVEQRTPLAPWTNHLQQAYYDGSDIPKWTLEHPYDNPLKPLTRGLPPSDYSLHQEPLSWKEKKMALQDYAWVDLNTSLQWHAFQRIVGILQQRGNRVFVLVGPFNEHLMTEKNRVRYQEVKATIAKWLESQQIPHAVPAPLPSELYGDASHPLAAGYEKLARQLGEEPFFQNRK